MISEKLKIHKMSYLLVLLVILVPITLIQQAQSLDKEEISPHASKLRVATRHDSSIYNKMAAAFASSSLGNSVGITSASDLRFYAPTTYDGFYRHMTDSNFGVSIGWGGGPTLFNTLINDDAISPITNPTVVSLLESVVPNNISGATTRSYNSQNQLLWAASALSSFGFTVNLDVLAQRNLPKPTTWEELASPNFFTSQSIPNVGLGNAPDTTSNTRIYQILIQKFGWEKAFAIMTGMAGNGKIYGGSVETRSSVIQGETAVAMTIDFYGLIAMQENPRTEYIVPENASIVNGDPIALAKAPPHPEAANAFLRFVFSQEGQAILLDKKINRLPIRADAFDTDIGRTRSDIKALYTKTLENQGIQFDEELATATYESTRYHFESMITNVHPQLVQTWAALASDYKKERWSPHNEQRWEELFLAFGKPEITIERAKEITSAIGTNANVRRSNQSEWEQAAIDKFRAVNDMRDDPFSFPMTTSSLTSESSSGTGESMSSSSVEITSTTSIIPSSPTTSSSSDLGNTFRVSVFFLAPVVAVAMLSFISYILKKRVKKGL